ncbi:TPA: hypothetical protein DIU27_01720 [Candidatus Collierbacteria bacterium]|uniref:Chromate transporter n=1 Tax=Candidatus Collierbacteria bacterium GW2011_GWB2_44_22 TaxID=1618387 RepID=A0A0G1KTH4_9BACT|nr:MAG: hypothetical protein UW31_C0012G0006 [Candidatus Collierbacteria bacterium GW2011_GWA2_44_13]KKT51179.1 MAG: hypothetical protein UW44_C0015G0050 [Candidatus Collierbacteria bacterium GW2011_GWB2_44_22]KKT61266.1 MAG: hypothetical protein UW56_C0029G0006 [Candidatus Collierbacteria bacterium GW2011_GWD1_44_27]KKT65984.1 MAG: hypothetical protein UW58_C0015G0006 [Candidatus Collierbacteria bacterium GW2011_GWC2_44_30]KKT68255.1 MAG: hypothetical protein UW64_C0025G0006 [Microgenomates gr
MDGLTNTLDLYLVKKAPALPKSVKEFIVSVAPWLEVIGAVFTLPAIFALFGFNAMMYGTPYGSYVNARAGYGFSLSTLFLFVGLVLMILAIPGLFKRSKVGWNYVFYSVLINAVYSLLSYQLFGMIVGTLISLYLLFQVKSYYK